MKRNELTILAALGVIGLLVAFWLVVLGPKRQEASKLQGDVDQLQSQLAEAQQSAAAGQAARRSFGVDYRKLVVMGKAVPADGDQASLLVQLQKLADRSGVGFESIDLSETASSTTTASPTSTTPSSTSSSTPSSTAAPAGSATSTSTSSTSSTSTASTGSTSTGSSTPAAEPTAVPTEASAATLPIGASIGPAGLPVMPYDLRFTGGFFQIADFLKRVDGMVHLRHAAVEVNGRLLTVNAFTLEPIQSASGGLDPVPTLTASLTVTTYLTPSDQGITAGATPGGPPAATPTPAASTTGTSSGSTASTSTSVPTATAP